MIDNVVKFISTRLDVFVAACMHAVRVANLNCTLRTVLDAECCANRILDLDAVAAVGARQPGQLPP